MKSPWIKKSDLLLAINHGLSNPSFGARHFPWKPPWIFPLPGLMSSKSRQVEGNQGQQCQQPQPWRLQRQGHRWPARWAELLDQAIKLPMFNHVHPKIMINHLLIYDGLEQLCNPAFNGKIMVQCWSLEVPFREGMKDGHTWRGLGCSASRCSKRTHRIAV